MDTPKTRRVTILAGIAVLAITPVLSAQSPDSPREDIVAEIARLDSIWLNAYVTADVEAVMPILADDFEGQIYDTVMGREELLDRVAGSRGLVSTRLEALVINVYEDVAVAHARRLNERRVGDSLTVERFVYTDVYIWRDERWQCITGQSAPVLDDG
ncbi:MAG: nuclear transport factor 2 family protein [Gemmatimonadota bacterium]|nr:nuclear transport factor 2 family protein [Gemmatimonadota bacterium]